MLTVEDLQTQRQARATVNHETYKQLWKQVQGTIRTRATNNFKDLMWQIPPLVPGRPVFNAAHAARYVSEKLRLGGFVVSVASPAPDVQMLYITWPPRPTPPPQKQKHHHTTTPARTTTSEFDSRSLDKLKAKLRIGG